jgi:hypothetical protein
MAGATGIAADVFRATDRRRRAYPVVVDRGGPKPPAQANSSPAPIEQIQSPSATELNVRAAAALDEAYQMPPGDGRAEAMNKAMMLRNAAEIYRHLFSRTGATAQ